MNKIKAHEQITQKMRDTYIRKNNDYGDSFACLREEFGSTAILIRLSDKLNRLKVLMTKQSQQKVFDESIEDTLLDLANYAVLELVEIRMENEQYQASLTKCNAEGSEKHIRPMGVEEAEKKIELDKSCDNCRYEGQLIGEFPCNTCQKYSHWETNN